MDAIVDTVVSMQTSSREFESSTSHQVREIKIFSYIPRNSAIQYLIDDILVLIL